jgi:hypothetical protein
MKLLLFLVVAFGWTAAPCRAADREVLDTPHFHIVLTLHCEEGEVGCSNITYVGVNKTSGKSIRLHGSTYMVMCADGVTPCHAGFDEFHNGNYRYVIYPDGTLTIMRGKKELLTEKGQWLDDVGT